MQNGIDYDETNENCTTYEMIQNITGINNSLEVELYFPEIQFQPKNDNKPVIISYKQYFYQISKYSNKIDSLFLQEYVFSDDNGWLKNKIKNTSYWGFSTITGNSYCSSGKKDLISEGSTSRFYSLNIYLNPGIIYYERKYKKLTKIFSEGIPIMYIVFLIFKNIVIVFKLTEENKMLIELLFENLKKKTNNFEKNVNKIKQGNNFEKSRSSIIINQNISNNIESKLNINDQKSRLDSQPKKSEASNFSNMNLFSLVNKSPNLPIVSKNYYKNLNLLSLSNINKRDKNENKQIFPNSVVNYHFSLNFYFYCKICY